VKSLLIVCTAFSFLIANGVDELNLLEDLNLATEISTKTKLNSNKTPSIVSVLRSDELHQLGIRTVYEALELVPGIQTSIGTAGAKEINMRGNKSFIRDKMKLMIDGVSVNSELIGSSYFYLDFPIENIDRIEIIRGPAATIYGSFAHIGVINIITKSSKKKKNVYFMSHSSENRSNVGFTQKILENDVDIAIDGFFTNNKQSRETGPFTPITSQSAFQSREDYTNKSIGMHLDFKNNLSFLSRYIKLSTQNYYGYGDWPILDDPQKIHSTSLINELRYQPKISGLLSDIKLGYKTYQFDGNSRLKPTSLSDFDTIAAALSGNTILAFPYDLLGQGLYKEDVLYSDILFKKKIDSHSLLFGAYFSQSKIKKTYYLTNIPFSTTLDQAQQAVRPNVKRDQYALFLNDIYDFNHQISFNFGLRLDKYSDVSSKISHKLAALYDANDKDTYKLIYQRSFRAPSFLELYGGSAPYIGDTSLKSEIIDTLEFSFAHQHSLKENYNINLFYSKMKDYIANDPATFRLFNNGNIYSYGLEVEGEYSLNSVTRFGANYSYVHMKDSSDHNAAYIANHLGNLILTHNLNSKITLGSRVRYIGEKKHLYNDTRSNTPDYLGFDQTVTYRYKNFSLQGSVRNLFDDERIDPSPLGNNTLDLTTGSGTYENDFHRDGRTFWISAKWEFE